MPLTPFSTSLFFPDATEADEQGLVAIGGCLKPDWLLDAYSHGLFPWPFADDRKRYHLGWFSTDPRCIFEFDRFHVSRRLARPCRSGKFTVTSDRDFRGVMLACATASHREGGTWITPKMIDAYTELHRLGHAHSVETWHEGRLVGGVYGVALRGLFAAESMFFRQRDASKVALVALIKHLQTCGFQLIDIQVATEHTLRLGAVEISRNDYLVRLHEALNVHADFGKNPLKNVCN